MDATIRQRLHQALGSWEIRFGPPEIVEETPLRQGTLFDLRFAGSHGQTVPASFALPEAPGPVPAVLWAHAHGARYTIGRRELTEGRPALRSAPLADLLGLGCAVLCVEMPCFGARAAPGEQALAKALLWQGRTLFGQMLAELAAGLDFLAAHPAIDAGRLGMAGISMGATQSFWLAALDPRIAAVAHLCAFADLGRLVETGAHDGHGLYMVVPGLLPLISTGALAGLVAPRPQLVCLGLQDAFTPARAVTPARAELEAAYARTGAPAALEFVVDPASGHVETPAMRAALLAFFRRHLAAAAPSLQS